MIVEKRSLNWLPKPSVYAANEAARAKRRSHIQSGLANANAMNGALVGGTTANTGEQINLTLRIAATRIQDQAQAKLDKVNKVSKEV